MLRTLIGKFTFFFWLIFFIITIPTYIFTTVFVKDIFQNNEKEKVAFMINALKPTIAYNISFNQKEHLDKLLQTILHEKNIQAVALYAKEYEGIFTKESKKKSLKFIEHTAKIEDPFSNENIGELKLTYSNENIILLYTKISKMLFFIALFALILFVLFYLFIKKELNVLKYIATSLEKYTKKKQISPIIVDKSTSEIHTIATSANEMMENISEYLKVLETFNTELEKQVQEKVQELQIQEKMMIHQSRQAAMGEMIESIAHQWRQPLNIIGLSCANLETEYQLGVMSDDNFYSKIEIISHNINYMSDTIDDFRNFLDPTKRNLCLFDPRKTVEETLLILQDQLRSNAIDIEIQGESPLEMYGAENEFKQVIFVLINNAKDAIKAKIKKNILSQGHILITFAQKQEYAEISFCDNGGGIKEEIMHSVFDPYFTTKFASSGTGIGLYIAKNIIESRMKGKLNVHNTEDGCCFTIRQEQGKKE